MSHAVSIHVGVNRPGGRPYDADLLHCEGNTWRMAQLANQAGFESLLVLRGAAATRQALDEALRRAARVLEPEGTVLVTYAGHGCQVVEATQLRDDRGGMDQGWCLSDGIVLDDQLAEYWRLFQPGARIVVVSESCYSGGVGRDDEDLDFCYKGAAGGVQEQAVPSREGATIYRDGGMDFRGGAAAYGGGESAYRGGEAAYRGGGAPGYRGDTPAFRGEEDGGPDDVPHYRGAAAYDAPCISEAPWNEDGIQASVLLLAACRENQKARDGLFSCHLLRLWDRGAFQGSYCELYWRLRERVLADKPDQDPQIVMLGSADPGFASKRAFHVDPRTAYR